MDLFQIINDIAQADPELTQRLDPRRQVFRHFAGYGRKVAAAALPLALPALFSKAYGQTGGGSGLPAPVVGVLNLALQLEHLEKFYYETGLASNILTTEQRRAFEIILNDENLHIRSLLGLLRGDAVALPTRADFDYTGSNGGRRAALFPALGATFTDLPQFLAAAKGFVYTGVRAYKGGAPVLMSNKDVLEAALNIHSVEARHSARIRSFIRGGVQSATAPKSWITPDETGNPTLPSNYAVPGAATSVGPYNAGLPAATFPAENNVQQGQDAATMQPIDVQALAAGLPAGAGAEAYDEPLNGETVKAIAKNFAANPAALFN